MIERYQSNQRMSQVVRYNGMIFLSGQVAKKTETENIASQTKEILENIEALLISVGSGKSKLLSASIWVTDMKNFQAMNEIWDSWVGGENPPVRACVEANLARPELLVEIQVTAAD